MCDRDDDHEGGSDRRRRQYRETVADPSSVYFIAEAGVNHNGEVELAKQLVDVAVESGADAVKFQTFRADRLVTADAAQADYQTETTETESQYDMLRRYELEPGQHERLQAYCREREITFLSTPFDRTSANLLADLDVPMVKLGSGELDNHPLLEHVAAFGVPMIVSTGMGTIDEVRAAESVIREVDPTADVVFLHCTSAYPTDPEAVNLRALETIDAVVDGPVGYSDHTTAVEVPALAVAAGADVVEKHLTLDSTLPGPDHAMSMEPDEFAQTVELARTAAIARGEPTKQPTATELENRPHIRKSLHARAQVDAGDRFSEATVAVLRPTDGLAPPHYDAVVGSRAANALEPGDPITAADVQGDLP